MSFLVERKTNGKRRAPGVLLGKTEGGILLKKENSGAEHSEMMIVDEKNIVFLQQDKMIRLFFRRYRFPVRALLPVNGRRKHSEIGVEVPPGAFRPNKVDVFQSCVF